MSEGHQTEEEQIEALKKWWKENGKSTMLSIVVAVAAVVGWRGWQEQQQSAVDAASAIYQNLLSAANGANGTASPEQLTTANHLASTLKEDYPNSTYAHFAALYKAKFAVEKNDLDTAEQELRWILTAGATPELTLQAQLRLARVLYAAEQYDEALLQLDINSSAYVAAFEEVKGDVYLAQGNKNQARQAYQKAVNFGQQSERPETNPLLDLKLKRLMSEAVADSSEGV